MLIKEKILQISRKLVYGSGNNSNENIALIKNYRLYKKHSALFIHIPKAAGVSFHYGIYGGDSLGHVPLNNYIKKYGEEKVNRLFKFTIVRNPYDRLASAYNYLKQGGRKKKNDIEYQNFIVKFKNFEDFVLNGFNTNEYLKIEHLLPQVYWLKNTDGQIRMDYIGRFETLETDFKKIIKLLGKNSEGYSLPFKNKSKNNQVQEFTPEMLQIVNGIYAEDFEMLGYDKI